VLRRPIEIATQSGRSSPEDPAGIMFLKK